jgi:thioesterase domain-containing protein
VSEGSSDTRPHSGPASRRADSATPVLLNHRELPGRPLFLVHPVGGTVTGYQDLAKRLSVPVYGFENVRPFAVTPKRESSVNEMAASYLPEVLKIQPQGPYALGGYSMGGVVAFELACQLRQAGHEVDCLISFDTPVRIQPPGDSRDEPTAAKILMIAQVIGSRRLVEITLVAEEIERVPAAKRFEYLVGELKRQKVIPPHVNPAIPLEVIRTSLNNEDLQRRYVAGMFDRPIFLLRALTPHPPLQAETGASYDDPSFGWQAVTTAPVEIVWLPGEHLTIMHEPHVEAVAAAVQRRLDRRGDATAIERSGSAGPRSAPEGERGDPKDARS